MASEKFCLSWNDFESNISSSFRELRDDKDFFDVTIACEDDQLEAHKVILSASSPFFRKVLRRNPHNHPLIYLKGVKQSDMKAIMNFMYHGEVTVVQEQLNTFLAVAEDLKIKGLTTEKVLPVVITPESYKEEKQQQQHRKVFTKDLSPKKPEIVDSYSLEKEKKAVADKLATALVANDILQQGGANMDADNYHGFDMAAMERITAGTGPPGEMLPSDLLQYVIPHTFEDEGGRGGYLCAICLTFKHIYKANVRNHVESRHFKGHFAYRYENILKSNSVAVRCEICGAIKNSKQDVYACKSEHNRSMKVEAKFSPNTNI